MSQDYIKLKIFCTVKVTTNRVKRQSKECKIIYLQVIYLVRSEHPKLLQINNKKLKTKPKKQNNPLKNGQKV